MSREQKQQPTQSRILTEGPLRVRAIMQTEDGTEGVVFNVELRDDGIWLGVGTHPDNCGVLPYPRAFAAMCFHKRLVAE